ncbi:hypothetical protein MBLNU13_g01332t1 [Cladosporium sp. NU13]
MTSRSTVAKLPCDACRRRKVRCDYGRPCDRCQSYNLDCTFDSVRKKRGPKKGKGAVVQQLREESRSKATPRPESPSGTSVSASAGVQQTSSTHEQWQDGTEFAQHREMPPASAHAYSPYTRTHASARSGLSNNVYTETPAEAFAQINAADPGFMNDDYLTFDEFAHVILGSSAQLPAHATIPQANSSPAQFADLFSNIHSGTIPPTPTYNPTFELNSITERSIDLFFSHLYPIYPILDERAIRTSLSNTSELDSASNFTILSPPPLSCDIFLDEDPSVSRGLSGLHSLFSLLNFDFVQLWNELASLTGGERGFPELSRLQVHLRQDLGIQGLSDIQRADVLITQQWLRLVFWQAALRLGLISSSAADSAFTYHYPVEIASSLCEIVKSLPPVAIQVHGLGIFEKQFEIAYSLLDALTLSGATQPADHYETLRYLLLSLSASPNSRQIYVRTLEKKMGGGPEGTGEQQKYRHLAGVQLLRDDGSIRQPSRRASVITG